MAKEKMASIEQIREIKQLYTNIYDSYSNYALSQGLGTTDFLNATQYLANNRMTWNITNIMQVEREEPIFRKILNYRASMSLKGFDINSKDMKAEEIKVIKREIKKLYLPLYQLIYQGEAFGGGASLICIKGQMSERELMKPLNIDMIEPGYFLGLKTLERWIGIHPSGELVESIGDNGVDDPNLLGEPLYFKVRLGGKKSKQYKVHRSRLLIYTTGMLPEIQKRIEQYWGVSTLERIWEPLNRYKTCISAVINMFLISSQRVLKTDVDTDFAQMTERAYEAMKTKLELMAKSLNYSNVLFIGSEDEFKYENVTMSNVSEVIKSIRLDLTSSAFIPYSILFEDGVNDNQTTENAHSYIKQIQDMYVYNFYNKLIDCIYKSKYGGKVPDYEIVFAKVREIGDKETADVIGKMVDALVEVYKANGMNKETFIKSLSEIMQNNNDIFNNFDDEFIKKFGDKTYNEEQIELARALNQGKNQNDNGKEIASENYGGQHNEKKPTPKVKIKEGSEKS